MGGFESAVYRELNYPESIGIYTVGKSVNKERNKWFEEILTAFEGEGAEVEGYWIGMGQDYDVEANIFDYGFEDSIDQELKLLIAPKPSVYRFNDKASEMNPLDNYTALAQKVGENLDAVMMKGLEQDRNGRIPSANSLINNIGNCLSSGSNMISMESRSTGEEALLVKSTNFPYDVPPRASAQD